LNILCYIAKSGFGCDSGFELIECFGDVELWDGFPKVRGVDVDVSAGVLLFLRVVDYLRWSKEQLQFFKVALELSRDVRGEFWGGTVSSGQHSGWCGHGDRGYWGWVLVRC
jgi:hypothetical protein